MTHTQEAASHPRRVLLIATGLSPQVVTETIYALAVRQNPKWIPTEVQLVTTVEGAERARLSLLSGEPGWFRRLVREYSLPPIQFNPRSITVLAGKDGPMEDVRTEDDNRRMADSITELIRKLTADELSALHVSMAGGRKTMGFYFGYALSLYGRPQDRLSHVLVSAPFESHPDFYYPSKKSRVIFTPPPESRPLDTATAQVTLAEIPFVRLRHGLPDRLLEGSTTFTAAVQAAQGHFGPPMLEIDFGARSVKAGSVRVSMAPAELAFYGLFARRAAAKLAPVNCPPESGDTALAELFLREYQAIAGGGRAEERTTRALRHGMDKDYFLQRRSRIEHTLRDALGAGAEAYLIGAIGRRPDTSYALRLEPQHIRFMQPEEEQS